MKLFGGAIEATVPDDYYDASEFRDVPDNQEMFVGEIDGFTCGFIVELCETVKPDETLQRAFELHLQDIHSAAAVHPDGPESVENTHETVGGREVVGVVQTVQDPKKGRSILVFGLFRIPEHSTDVIITQSIELGHASLIGTTISSLVNVAKTNVSQCAGTFKLLDASLFEDKQ